MQVAYRWHPDPERCREFDRVMRLAVFEGAAETSLHDLVAESNGESSRADALKVVEAIESFGYLMQPNPRESGGMSTRRVVVPMRSSEQSRELLRQRIKQGEGQRLELKSTYLRCTKALETDPQSVLGVDSLKKAVLKSICAFLNSEGGEIIVGVDNKGQIVGIELDYPLVTKGKPYEDPLEMWRQQLFRDIQGNFHEHSSIIPSMVQVDCIELEGRMVAWIRVLRSDRIRLARRDFSGTKSTPFVAFVRREYESIELEAVDFESYVLRRRALD